MIVSPGVLACSTSVMSETAERATTSAALTVVTALPMARTRVSPTAPVITCASRVVAPSIIAIATVAMPAAFGVKAATAGL